MSGTGLAVLFFHYYTGEVLPWGDAGSLQFRVLYGLLLLASFLIALFRGKQAHAKLDRKNEILTHLDQETANELLMVSRECAYFVEAFREAGVPALTELTGLSRALKEGIKGSNVPESVMSSAHKLQEKLSRMAVQLDRLDHRAVGYLRLDTSTTVLGNLLESVDRKLQAKGIAQNITFHNAIPQMTLQCDVTKIQTLLVKAVSFLRITLGGEVWIGIHVDATQLGYLLPAISKNYTKKIKAVRFTIRTASALPKYKACYPTQASELITTVPQAPEDLPLVTNQRIVSAHYGHAEVTQNELIYVIPVDVKEVRPKDMDKPYMELGVVPVRANDHYKQYCWRTCITMEASTDCM